MAGKNGKHKRSENASAETQTNISINTPSIPFDKPKKSKEKSDDEGNYKKIEVPIEPGKRNSKTIEKKIRVFGDSDTSPEAWVKWRIELDEIIRDYPLESGDHKSAMALALMKGSARDKFQQTLLTLDNENAEKPVAERTDRNVVFDTTLIEVGKSYFPIMYAYQKQLNYMQHYLKLGSHTVRNFATRLRELNNYLPYFPREKGKPEPCTLSDDELVFILNQAKPEEWQAVILGANIELYQFDFQGTVDYFEKLEVKQALEAKRRKIERSDNTDSNKGQGNKNYKPKDKSGTSKPQSKDTKCSHCGRTNHATKDCWFSPENKGKTRNGKKTSDKMVMMSTEQLNTILAQLLPRNPKSGTRKVRFSPVQEDTENVTMYEPTAKRSKVDHNEFSDEDSIYLGLHTKRKVLLQYDEISPKRHKTSHKTTELVGKVHGTNSDGILRILLDTGASATIILKDAIKGLSGTVIKEKPTKWTTVGGQFVTTRRREINFTLPEFSTSKDITWTCHEDSNTLRKNAQYDMIIGADLLTELGIELNFNTQRMIWEGIEIPMKDKHVISDLQNATAIYYQSIEPTVLKEAEARQKRILDADYSALDLDDYAHLETHLSKEQQEQLIRSLRKYPKLFRGGLGVLKVPPVHFDLRPMTKDEKPYHARPFPIPKCYEETTKKEIQRLCNIGVLEKCNDSEWAAPTFIQPKKTGDVRVLTDFRILNKYIKRKPYPLPKISDLLQKLEGFTWATALDLSMGYYHIVLDKESSYLCTLILPWGKYPYCRLPMGLTDSPDIFQAIINDLMIDLQNVRAYLDDILVTTAGSFEDHLKHVELVLQRLNDVGFAVNLRKSKFAVTEIDYLGYWITRNGIQPQPKKVEAIMRLTPPTTKRQLRRFLGMINYYRDMWRRRSHVLAPLTTVENSMELKGDILLENKNCYP